VAAGRWVAQHLDEFGGDARLGVAGDSAGGNLAAVVAQQLTADGTPVAAQFLIYPAVDAAGEYPSRVENATGYFLEQPTMDWFYGHYAGSWEDPNEPRLSPLHAADLGGLPPAVIVTAEYDPLRDEGEAYGAALRAAGVATDVRRFDGMIHGFFDMGTVSPAARTAVQESCVRFGEVLRADGPGGSDGGQWPSSGPRSDHGCTAPTATRAPSSSATIRMSLIRPSVIVRTSMTRSSTTCPVGGTGPADVCSVPTCRPLSRNATATFPPSSTTSSTCRSIRSNVPCSARARATRPAAPTTAPLTCTGSA
jgi:dienelactone hydrolase